MYVLSLINTDDFIIAQKKSDDLNELLPIRDALIRRFDCNNIFGYHYIDKLIIVDADKRVELGELEFNFA